MVNNNSIIKVINGDCLKYLREGDMPLISLSFIDPPFRQGKNYRYFDDDIPEKEYWEWMKNIFCGIYARTAEGGAVYFMQREKNVEWMLRLLRETGWSYQNLIIWKKKTSAVPSEIRFAKQYQVIVYATKGNRPRVFNKLRIDLPLAPEQKYPRSNGVYLTDVWDDIRELTSGYFAGDEALREPNGERSHEQQSPIGLLLRIILSSSMVGDVIFDPFAGTGTTLVVAKQLYRNTIGVEIDPKNASLIDNRVTFIRPSDNINK